MIPRLADLVWNSTRLWPLAVGVGVSVVLVVGWLYRPQVRGLAKPWNWILPTIRILALLVLAVSLLQPVLVRPASPGQGGSVLILIDNSRSMGVRDLPELAKDPHTSPDPQWATSYLVELAEGLNLIPTGLRDSTWQQIRSQVAQIPLWLTTMARIQGEIAYARISDAPSAASNTQYQQLAAKLDQAKKTITDHIDLFPQTGGIHDAVQTLTAPGNPRFFDIGRLSSDATGIARWLRATQAAVDQRLYDSNKAVSDACGLLAAKSRLQQVDLALTQPWTGLLWRFPTNRSLLGYTIGDSAQPFNLRNGDQPVDHLAIRPTGSSSELLAGVRKALAETVGQDVQAVVVFSDGRATGPEASADESPGAFDVPIYCVHVGAPSAVIRDAGMASVTLPNVCFSDETITARVQIRSLHCQDLPATVSLNVDDGPPITKTVVLNDAGVNVAFPLHFENPGVSQLTFSLTPPPGAIQVEDRVVRRWVKILSERVAVGLYSASADWDFQYVSNALQRTRWINLTRGVFNGASTRLNLSPDEILDLDLLILWDVAVDSLSPTQWDAVGKLVQDRGGSVLLVAGDQHLPMEYATHPVASSLLPYEIGGRTPLWRAWPGDEAGFRVYPAPGSAEEDALRLTQGIENSDQYWASLPAFYRYLQLPDLKPAARPLLIERDFSDPLLVENRVGRGRTFFMGMNETWRWRRKVGEQDQDRFWLQLVRYAADEPYSAHATGVWLDARPIATQPHRTVEVRAKVVDEDDEPAQDATQTVELRQNDRVIRKITLNTIGQGQWGRYRGRLENAPSGDFQLCLASPEGQTAKLPIHVTPDTESELIDLSGDDRFLRQLADVSGGQYFGFNQIGKIPDAIANLNANPGRVVQVPIWDSYYLYCFVVACFATEWAIRKRVGLT